MFGLRKLLALFNMAATVRLYRDLAKAFLVAFACKMGKFENHSTVKWESLKIISL